MSEYWKSQPRKFCKPCGCWISDNKASRDFHEQGKKHKENIAAQLKEARKRGAQVMKERDDLKSAMEQIEKKAKLAIINEMREWNEAVDEATQRTYYYNSKTGEKRWEKPNFGKVDTAPTNLDSVPSDTNNERAVEDINKILYKQKTESEIETSTEKATGLGTWASVTVIDRPIIAEELPTTEDFTTVETKFEVKKVDVINKLETEVDNSALKTTFKKSRAKKLRKRNMDD